MLAWACGIYPWKDVFLSSPGQRTVRDENRSLEETLISILSAGMVGPGDRIGFINKPLLMRTCRADGLLLKPDLPAMPIDKMFVSNNTLYTIITETQTAIGAYYYVLGLNLYPAKYLEREILFEDLGVKPGDYLVYKWGERGFQVEQGKIIYPAQMNLYRGAYYVLIPKQKSAPELIGEREKFVTVSKARFKSIETVGPKIKLTISGVPNEELELGFRSERKPAANIISGASLADSKYDPAQGIFILRMKMVSESAELEVGG